MHQFRRVTLRIDSHKHVVELVRIRAEFLDPARQIEQRRRAYFRAEGVAEIYRIGLAGERLVADWLAGIVDQREWPADRRYANVPGLPQADCEDDRQRRDGEADDAGHRRDNPPARLHHFISILPMPPDFSCCIPLMPPLPLIAPMASTGTMTEI